VPFQESFTVIPAKHHSDCFTNNQSILIFLQIS
jgi:hypothetical protein